MSTYIFDERSGKLKYEHEQTQIDSWQLQYTFFDTLQRHHKILAESSTDREVARIHTEIANLVEQARDQYKCLLDKSLPRSH